jgi:TIR domain-containing protein
MTGVFINYRTADQPHVAAAIHDHLARRFGSEQVFRDCVSMRAGADYPDEIRAALEKAGVLVAIIGPKWLSARDAGVRLIDRSGDWVRFEITRALQRGIPVLPVLLKDTPADAEPLEVADLPSDISSIAHKQAFEFSHFRFGVDMDRLTERLAELVPALEIRDDAATSPDTMGSRPQVVTHLRDVSVSRNAVFGVNNGDLS